MSAASPVAEERRVFRFAPSPNGLLHLGHAYSALLNHDLARAAGGAFLLRLEDIDRARCTPAFERRILDDLQWLGLGWDAAPRRQHEHFDDYATALDALQGEGLVYPGFMTRGETRAFASAFEEREGLPWPRDPDGAPLYPALDRDLGEAERRGRIAAGEPFAWRLDMGAALERLSAELAFEESGGGGREAVRADPALWGDVVLARFDTPTSYHLAVSVDDALQGVTDVVRGRDLLPSTSVHRLLQALLGLPVPRYHHHDLILGGDGRKLSKSRGDAAVRTLGEAGLTPEDIRRMVGLGLAPR
ncbi:tRNA glutamyl-Q(34) synthetase GluQRS [Aureimonas pseudogalii]|uniref:Glutamyl-Q tRNA(Asp) synthetase n=1 Tax=Aureimonas pseudogalii TaxID=1744844 RepID=A0A7W6E7S1_9HYPH|nr:tRNA glutamyl-Q(34) synthetase GluQRS [Aureimonas pseudogalii]MBB3996292.1 glutamyl-Q tRNA(Asp) synthetase [Aureimonas pseudogalii]